MRPVVPIRATEIPVRYAKLVLGTLAWPRHEGGLGVWLPAEEPCEHPYALKIVIR